MKDTQPADATLRDYQQKVIDAIRAAIRAGGDRTIFILKGQGKGKS